MRDCPQICLFAHTMMAPGGGGLVYSPRWYMVDMVTEHSLASRREAGEKQAARKLGEVEWGEGREVLRKGVPA